MLHLAMSWANNLALFEGSAFWVCRLSFSKKGSTVHAQPHYALPTHGSCYTRALLRTSVRSRPVRYYVAMQLRCVVMYHTVMW